jgi:RNA polymerase sigma factor (sigma-70 family)
MPATTARLAHVDDNRLARLVARGDDAAFEVLHVRHRRALHAYCSALLGSREDGDDAVQATLLRAHGALVRGARPKAVRGWLFAIARNRCMTMLAARRETAPLDEHSDVVAGAVEDDVARREAVRELAASLRRLPDPQRRALVLAAGGDLDHAGIAGILGCAPVKVRALVHQGRCALAADRRARETPCHVVRPQRAGARPGSLVRRHLEQCSACRTACA